MNLTEKLKAFDFMCVVENELYVLRVGEKTSLFVEGILDYRGLYVYLFYKQTEGRFSKVEYYGRELREKQLLARVETYFRNRQKQIMKQLARHGRGFQAKPRKELLAELLGKKKDEQVG